MAISVATVWEVRTTGSDTLNSGGFVAGATGTDYSQQDTPHVTIDNVTVTGTVDVSGNLVLGGYTVAATDVGNIWIDTSGSSPGAGSDQYQIVSVNTGTNTWVFDRALSGGNGTLKTGPMGGGFASLGRAGQEHVAGNKVWVKGGTYTFTNSVANTVGGTIGLRNATTPQVSAVLGYNTSRGDGGKPTLQPDGVVSAYVMIGTTGGTSSSIAANFSLIGHTGDFGQGIGNLGKVYNVISNGMDGTAFSSSVMQMIACGAFNGNGAGFSPVALAYACAANNNAGGGFVNATSAGTFAFCISANNAGGTTDGFSVTTGIATGIGCVSYKNGRDNFRTANTNQTASRNTWINSISWGGTNGFNATTALDIAFGPNMINCAAGGASGSNVTANIPAAVQIGTITLTTDPFTNGAGGDFSLNGLAGGGALLKATGFPSSLPGISTTSFPDIGAAQSAGGSGGGQILGG